MSYLGNGDLRQQTMLILQEMSTALRFLATEIDGALQRSGEVDKELLARIARTLSATHQGLLDISLDSDT
ncbi:MAG: hypothetical protein AMXMBFR4_01510 [Candidatus Hydrogenedentota bacterium]